MIIGGAGTGKSMAMRQICAEHEYSDHVFPLYVHAETWLARSLGEVAGAPAGASSPALSRVREYTNALLLLAVIDRLDLIGEAELAVATTEILSRLDEGAGVGAQSIANWIAHHEGQISDAVRGEHSLPAPYCDLPDLPDLLEAIGRIVRRTSGKRLLILIDQLDKVSPAYFPILATALRRSDSYFLFIATRPSPAAPDDTVIQTRVGDIAWRWMGKQWDSETWGDFLLRTASRFFETEVVQLMREAAPTLQRVVGPSTREFLLIANRVKSLLGIGLDPRVAIKQAISEEVSSFQSVLSSSLYDVASFATLQHRINDRVSKLSPFGSLIWPAEMRMVPDRGAVILDERIVRKLRVAVREGMLVPTDQERYGIDGPALRFRMIPMAVVPAGSAVTIANRPGPPIEIQESEFSDWTKTSFAGRPVEHPASVFYSHWMDDRNQVSKAFLEELARELRPIGVEATTGKVINSASRRQLDELQLSEQIRTKISDASVVVVQLDPPRLAMAMELGWALAIGRRCLTTASDPSALQQIPRPLHALSEIQWNGTDAGRKVTVSEVLKTYDHLLYAGGRDYFLDVDADGSKVNTFARDLSRIMIVGADIADLEVVRRVRDLAANENYPVPTLLDTTDYGDGNQIGKLVAEARRSSTLLAVFTGDQSADYLTALSLGAFTYADKDKKRKIQGIGDRELPRLAVALDLSERDGYVPYSMTGGLKGLFQTTNPKNAAERTISSFSDFRARLAPTRK